MDKLSEDILKFLLDGKAYSDTAILMNFGIDEEKLKEVYEILKSENFLETYGEYEKRNNSQKSSSGCSSGGCGTGGCGSCGTSSDSSCSTTKGCCNEKDLDLENVLVLTEKAINWF